MADSVLTRVPPPADARLAYGDAPEQFGDLRLPNGTGPFPAIAFIHGGFWRSKYDLAHAGNLCAALTAAGYATWNIEYRRIGNEGGAWPGTFQDVASGLRYLFDHAAEHGIDPAKIVAMGHSAGGHLALWAAGLAKIDPASEIKADPLPFLAAVSMAGAVDLLGVYRLGMSGGVVVELMGGTPDEFPERYAAGSPAALIPLGVHQLLIHGVEDDIVPVAFSEDYVAAATTAGDIATLLALPGIEHFGVIDPESAAFPPLLAGVSDLFAEPAAAVTSAPRLHGWRSRIGAPAKPEAI